jgi:hypothetical protein
VIQPPASQAQPAGYFEQLRTPWWWYLAAVGISVLLGAEFATAVSGWITWVPFVILLVLSLLVVWRLSSGCVAVSDGRVRAGERTVELSRVELAIDLTASELRRLVGRHSDPLAYTYVRSWVGPGVQLVLRPPVGRPGTEPGAPGSEQDAPGSEPDDRYPEPYWLISTRHPDRLVAAVQAAGANNTKPKGS